MTKTKYVTERYEDYVQSANTLFHFVSKAEYLKTILETRYISPRYCIENIDYLNIKNEELTFSEVAVLQSCFCDIPFHKLFDTIEVTGTGKEFNALDAGDAEQIQKWSTHPDFYGSFAIALSKKWGESHGLQPVQYINSNSDYARTLSEAVVSSLSKEDISDEYANDLLYRLAFIKPIRGQMKRQLSKNNSDIVSVDVIKNFHDEKEWRYVPDAKKSESLNLGNIIANPYVLKNPNFIRDSSNYIETNYLEQLGLDFSYNDVRYIIVPNAHERNSLIYFIQNLGSELFTDSDQAQLERQILISKIMVLDEVRKDW